MRRNITYNLQVLRLSIVFSHRLTGMAFQMSISEKITKLKYLDE